MNNLSKTSASELQDTENNIDKNVVVSNDISFSFHSVYENWEEILDFLDKYPKEEKNTNGFVAGERRELAKRIGSKIKDYMAINKYSEEEFSKLCGISRKTLRDILSANIPVFESRMNIYEKIATKGMEITLMDLLKKGEI